MESFRSSNPAMKCFFHVVAARSAEMTRCWVRYWSDLLFLFIQIVSWWFYNGNLVMPRLSFLHLVPFDSFCFAFWVVPAALPHTPGTGKKATIPLYKVLVRPGRESNSRNASTEANALTTRPRVQVAFEHLYGSGSQTYSSRYLNQGSNYVLLPSIFRSYRSWYRTTLWFWFCIIPRRIAYYPQGVIYPPVWEPLLWGVILTTGMSRCSAMIDNLHIACYKRVPWPGGVGAGRSGVRLSAGSYQDLFNWYCILLSRRPVCGRDCAFAALLQQANYCECTRRYLVCVGVSANHDRLLPRCHKARNVLADDGFPKHCTAQNVPGQ